MSEVRVVRIVVASASDVQAERDVIPEVIEYLNGTFAKDLGLRLEVSRWETDSYPRFHHDGPQGAIDENLEIEDCDLLIGIFWKRFGTPVKNARSGTEHEFLLAYDAWKRTGRPQIMFYFKEHSFFPQSESELEQYQNVMEFRRNFPEEGLWWSYEKKSQFKKLFLTHLTNFIRTQFPFHTPVQSQGRTIAEYGPTSKVELSIPRRPKPLRFTRVVWVGTLVFAVLLSLVLNNFMLRSPKPNPSTEPSVAAPIPIYDLGSKIETVPLKPYVGVRGDGTGTNDPPSLPASSAYVRLQLNLPNAEQEDDYDLSLSEATKDTVLFTMRVKRIDGKITLLMSQEQMPRGYYRLAVFHDGRAPLYFLFRVNRDQQASQK